MSRQHHGCCREKRYRYDRGRNRGRHDIAKEKVDDDYYQHYRDQQCLLHFQDCGADREGPIRDDVHRDAGRYGGTKLR